MCVLRFSDKQTSISRYTTVSIYVCSCTPYSYIHIYILVDVLIMCRVHNNNLPTFSIFLDSFLYLVTTYLDVIENLFFRRYVLTRKRYGCWCWLNRTFTHFSLCTYFKNCFRSLMHCFFFFLEEIR